MSNLEYMRQVRVQSVGLGGIVDENGRNLIPLGNLPIKSGDMVWTDGRVAYGHAPIRRQVNPIAFPHGVPFYDNNGGGYFNDAGKRCDYTYPQIDSESLALLINDDKKLFLTIDGGRGTLLDSEILTDEEGSAGGYICAYTDYISFVGDENIHAAQITLTTSSGESSVIQMADLGGMDALLSDVVDVCQADGNLEPTNIVMQVLYFRFTDKKGGWEVYLGFRFDVKLQYYRPEAPKPKVFLVKTTLSSREIISSEDFFGQTLLTCREQIDVSSSVYDEPITPAEYERRSMKDLFGVVKVTSSGACTIVGRNYSASEYINQYATAWQLNDGESASYHYDSMSATIVAEAVGSVSSHTSATYVTVKESYICRYLVAKNSQEVPAGTTSTGMNIYDVYHESLMADQTPTYTQEDYPAIKIQEAIQVDLPDGYRMILTAEFSSLRIYKGNKFIISYPMEPAPYYRPAWGIVRADNTSKYWQFPHLSLHEFDLGKCTAIAEYAGKIRKVDSGGLSVVGENAANMRMRRMRRIRVSR